MLGQEYATYIYVPYTYIQKSAQPRTYILEIRTYFLLLQQIFVTDYNFSYFPWGKIGFTWIIKISRNNTKGKLIKKTVSCSGK